MAINTMPMNVNKPLATGLSHSTIAWPIRFVRKNVCPVNPSSIKWVYSVVVLIMSAVVNGTWIRGVHV